MSVFVIDTSTDPEVKSYEQFQELDGREYQFTLDWNERNEHWTLGAYLPDGTRLAVGRKVVIGVPLFRGEIDKRLPPGLLIAVDASESGTESDVDELGSRVLLMYSTVDELSL